MPPHRVRVVRARFLFPALLILSVLGSGCSRNLSRVFNRDGVVKGTPIDTTVHRSKAFSLTYGKDASRSISLRYLGCAGYYIGTETNAVLFDPFFSQVKFMKVPFKKLRTNVEDVNFGLRGLEAPIFDKTSGIFVTHGHYDHLMDVPYVYNRVADKSNAKVYCSQSGINILRYAVGQQNMVNIEPNLTDHEQLGARYYIGDSTLRITPVKTTHSPHWHGVKLYKGESKIRSKYDNELAPSRDGWWREGQTFGFVLDVLEAPAGPIAFRIYLQATAAKPPLGLLPDTLRQEHDINLLLLGTASFGYVKQFPDSLVPAICPENILLCHWEDFFRPYQEYPKRTVRLTNMKKYFRRLEKVYSWKDKEGRQRVFMPDPGVDVRITY